MTRLLYAVGRRCTQIYPLLMILATITLPLTVSTSRQSASATSVLPLTLGQLMRQSQFIFVGRVAEKSVLETESGTIWTKYQIRIDDIWRGRLPQTDRLFELSLIGGDLGQGISRRGQVVFGQPKLEVGERGVFFLERSAAGHLVFTGLSQGWFPLETRGDGQVLAIRRDVQAHLHKPVKALTFTTSPKSLNEIPLLTLKRLVLFGRVPPKPVITPATNIYEVQPLAPTPLESNTP